MTNPLLSDWDTPFDLPPFDDITDTDFEPAMEAALSEARANVAAIADSPEEPTFANTIEALEEADALLSKVLGVFYNLAGADATETREGLQRKFSPQLAGYSSDILLNADLFARIDALWEARNDLDLTDEQARLLMITRRRFVRAGALLEGEDRDRYRAVMERLAVLGTEFTQNLLADERSWLMELGEADLEGLPDFAIDAARTAGDEKGVGGPDVTR